MNMEKLTVEKIIAKLQQVLEGEISREEASNWAERAWSIFDREGSLSETDITVWKCLDVVMGIDIKDSPTEYLHNEEDIKEWMSRFKKMY